VMGVCKKIILVDGNSLIHRAYHALPTLSNSQGQPTNAVFGLAQMLIKLLNEQQPTAALIAFDSAAETFRHQQYTDYKKDRVPTPEDLISQFPLARELVEALGLSSAEVEGYEADDIIGTMAKQAAKQGYEVVIVTGDRDLLQLVDDHIKVLLTQRGIQDTATYDVAAVREAFGLAPQQIVDLKGLAGDSSDSIPGVPGIGPKTARRLLEQYGSVEEVLAHADEVKGKKLRESLHRFADQARLSKELARICTQVPLDISPDQCLWDGYRLPQLRKLLRQLEFTSLLGRLPASDSEPEPLAGEIDEFEEFCRHVRQERQMCLIVVRLGAQRLGLALMAPGHETMTWQIVSTNTNPSASALFGDTQPRAADEKLQLISALLADDTIDKWGADLKSAAAELAKADVELRGCRFDACLASYLLFPHRKSHSLELLAAQFLGEDVALPRHEAEGGAARTAVAVIPRLREILLQELDKSGLRPLFEKVEMPLVQVLRAMEAAGIAVDKSRLMNLGRQLRDLLGDLSRRIFAIAGHDFNIDSPQQLATVLFEELKLPKGRKTKTGWSTSAQVLHELAAEHEIARLVLEYRQYAKLHSTYVEGLLGQIDPVTGRIHTTFEQMVTATGRLSSRNPNLQNIPIRTQWGREIRACFVAPDSDTVLLSADYSQIELRILAHMSGDPALVEAFKAGRDIHSATAATLFDVPPEQVTAEMRRVAKTVNYAVIYGMGATALSQQLGISRQEAAEFIDNYHQRMSGVKRFMEMLLEQARQDGFVETICGRRRPVPELHSNNPSLRAYAERAAGNAPLQGSAADIIKIAMVEIARGLPAVCPDAKMLLQVHDELVFEVPATKVQKVGRYVKGIMEQAWELSIPLVADIKFGPNWRDMTPLD